MTGRESWTIRTAGTESARRDELQPPCAGAMGTEAARRALVRFAQGQLGEEVGIPNDVGFENRGVGTPVTRVDTR